MKTFITFLLSLTVLLTGVIISGQTPDVIVVFAGMFAASLAAWTIRQYERNYSPLTDERPMRLPLRTARQANTPPPRRLAA